MKNYKRIKYSYIAADFETTTTGDSAQTDTSVWAACLIDLNADDDPKDAKLYGCIEDFFAYLENRAKRENLCVYFHNLKFDGSFILDFLLRHKLYKPAENFFKLDDSGGNYTYIYNISDKGIWYTIDLKVHGHYIQFRDSLKLMPFTLAQIGKSFKTKHQKLKMKYTGDRYPNCPISDKEREYIINDVLVLKESLNIMFNQGHDKLTIGSCCLSEYKHIMGKDDYEMYFPDLTKIEIDPNLYGAKNADEYIRKSYHGGWCYVVPEKAGKEYKDTEGTTADVNSLYPSMMHSDSGNYYPVGKPKFWRGAIPKECKSGRFYYFVRFKCSFDIKKDMLPTVQIKNSPLYYAREWLKTSTVKDDKGRDCDSVVTMTMTCTDYELFKKHYHVHNLKILDGCYFFKEIGLFDDYINHYAEIKQNSTGALRTLAKLFLNNLYGKFATNPQNNCKSVYLDGDTNALRMTEIKAPDKPAGFIAVGSAITSYSRRFTITAAQCNYHGAYSRGFIYADTDSIHCDLTADEIQGAPQHPTAFNHWKYESTWDYALFVRAKSYIEHVTHEDGEKIDKPYYNLKCAGMGDRAKNIFIASCTQDAELIKEITDDENFTPDELEYIKKGHVFSDFKVGLTVKGQLKAKRITGGTLLIKQDYVMRPNILDKEG